MFYMAGFAFLHLGTAPTKKLSGQTDVDLYKLVRHVRVANFGPSLAEFGRDRLKTHSYVELNWSNSTQD